MWKNTKGSMKFEKRNFFLSVFGKKKSGSRINQKEIYSSRGKQDRDSEKA